MGEITENSKITLTIRDLYKIHKELNNDIKNT